MRNRTLVAMSVGVLVAIAVPGRAETPVERRLRVLEEQLRAAQDEIQRLRGQVEQQRAIGQATQKQVEQTAEETKVATAEAKKSTELPDWLKRTAVFGDIRFRHEGFYHQPARDETRVTARNRERIRARIGVKATLSDELAATVRLASGNPDDPISTNQTLGETFTPKNINLDWAFITLTPGKTFGIRPGLLAVNAGKFPNPIFRASEMVFDDDLSPEGFSETVALLGAPRGALQQVKVHAFQWTFDEVNNAEDGWIFGGQVNPTFRVGPATIDVGASHHWYLNEDAIARATATNRDLKSTNLLRRSDDTILGYVNAFSVTNAGINATFANAIGTMPVSLFADFAHNWEAEEDDDGYLGGVKLGQTKVQGDWAIGAFYEHLEQEAANSVFTASDFGLGGTNNEGPVVSVEYQLLNPLTLTARNYFVNFIDRPAGTSNPTLFRLQLDALVRF
ncbi:MAG TPA: putative porin [Candidatus Binatia bacterium]|nr:putative porin [Candidatus Binatia bacterium]